jgi:hypothetical protein
MWGLMTEEKPTTEEKIQQVEDVLDRNNIEGALLKLWEHAVQPTHIQVNKEAIKFIAQRRPGGGNSHQRRSWRRIWTPKQ